MYFAESDKQYEDDRRHIYDLMVYERYDEIVDSKRATHWEKRKAEELRYQREMRRYQQESEDWWSDRLAEQG